MDETGDSGLTELSVVGVRVELPSQQPIVLLKEAGGDRYLPIWIGAGRGDRDRLRPAGRRDGSADDARPAQRPARRAGPAAADRDDHRPARRRLLRRARASTAASRSAPAPPTPSRSRCAPVPSSAAPRRSWPRPASRSRTSRRTRSRSSASSSTRSRRRTSRPALSVRHTLDLNLEVEGCDAPLDVVDRLPRVSSVREDRWHSCARTRTPAVVPGRTSPWPIEPQEQPVDDPTRSGRHPVPARTSRARCSTTCRPTSGPARSRRRRLPRADGVLRRRHHLPPARLLGPHRAGRAERPRGVRLRHPAAVLLPRHPGPQGRQEAPRRRRLAAEHPDRDRHAPRPRRRGPRPDHPDERRHHGLRVHQHRRGRRPAAGRPGRLRDRGRPSGPRRRGHPRPAARGARASARRPATPVETSWRTAGTVVPPPDGTSSATLAPAPAERCRGLALVAS